MFIPGDIPEELASLLVRAIHAADAPEGAVVPVSAQLTMGKDLDRFCRKPPVHKVEMVCCLMNEKGTRKLFQPVPSAEIGCAVVDIQIIIEIHRCDLPDLPGYEYLFDLHGLRTVAVIERDHQLFACLPLCIQNLLGHLLVSGHRLLGDHITSHLHRLADVFGMKTVRGGHDHSIRLSLIDHPAEIGECRTLRSHVGSRVFQADGIDVAEPDHLQNIAVICEQRFSPCATPSDPGADQGNFAFSARWCAQHMRLLQ